MNPVLRAPAILINPPAGWERIEKDAGDVADLLFRYVAPLALVPPLSGFVGVCIIGVIVPRVGPERAPLLAGIFGAIFGYLESIVLVLLLALIVNIAAPLFGGRRSFAKAFMLTIYSYTPVWLSGIFLVLPGLRFLVLTGFYGAYVLVAGLPLIMKSSKERSPSFAALILIFACALTFIAAALQSALFGTPDL